MRLPQHYLQLVADTTHKSFWRRKALRSFLRRSGVSENFLATWTEDETKQDFLDRLFPRLEQSDKGVAVINRMADGLAEQRTFPDLENWEDSAEKKEQAHKAVAALRSYLHKKRDEAAEERSRETTRRNVQAIREQRIQQQQNLEKLGDRLNSLALKVGTQDGGYDFQEWFFDLLDYYEITSRRPYNSGGRQIDGSLTIDGTTYLVELKFTLEQISPLYIGDFHKKVLDKADNTMGIMVSICGYSPAAKDEASGPRTPLLLLEHQHLYALLSGGLTFAELVNRVRRHSSQTGRAYLDVKDFSA